MPINLNNKPILLVEMAPLRKEYCVECSIFGDNDWLSAVFYLGSKNNHILNVICSIYLSEHGN